MPSQILLPGMPWTAAKRGFLFPVWAVSKVFRGKFVTALKAARGTGKLHGEWSLDAGPWRALLARLHAHEWVVYAKQSLGGPAQVLEYLGRYTHRVAISNERIVAVDDREVRFRVRDSAAGNRKRLLRLPAETFIDRLLLHVLPPGFKRIRHYGLLAPAAKAVKLAQARAALAVPAPDPVVVESVAALMRRIERIGWARCPHCGQGAFVPTASIPMPTRPFTPADRRKSAMASAWFTLMPWRPKPSGIVAAIAPQRPRPPSACRRFGPQEAIVNDGPMTSPSPLPSRSFSPSN
ncbi:MAG: transposase [Vicinamibacterales bacterium]